MRCQSDDMQLCSAAALANTNVAAKNNQPKQASQLLRRGAALLHLLPQELGDDGCQRHGGREADRRQRLMGGVGDCKGADLRAATQHQKQGVFIHMPGLGWPPHSPHGRSPPPAQSSPSPGGLPTGYSVRLLSPAPDMPVACPAPPRPAPPRPPPSQPHPAAAGRPHRLVSVVDL